ncbi:DNA replication/repair protein RecF [Spirochaeta cellobiosiphila]|uniref:DNA replication/repair protein RecF n=1 Tax=Spirochaeta cellobiosiphila TaxID=504483 RepID=UPI0004259228|nr:DNA replication and repair protein RecF [Spirochaeta cellobiosiphila]
MPFNNIKLYNFRNLLDKEISLNGREIFLIGENGQGKTNFLEAIYVLCYGSSFRTKQDKILIKNQKDDFSAIGQYFQDEMEHKIHFKLQKGKKSILIDDKQLRDRKELIWKLPCIVFSHEDIFLVSGTPEERRNFFDQTLSLYDPDYIDLLREYKKILKHRNIVLKRNEKELIDILNIQIVSKGLELRNYRSAITKKFNKVFSQLFKYVSQLESDLFIEYKPSWKENDTSVIIKNLERKFEQENILGITTSGPHRDNYRFIMEGKDFSQLASTGQSRLISLILKVAQGVFFTQETGKKPILLLDDVLLELDSKKRARFLEVIPEYDQAFFTFLPDMANLSYRKDDTIVYSVESGDFITYEK